MKIFNAFLDSCLKLLYPSFCLHCSGDLDKGKSFLCSSCSELIETLEPQMNRYLHALCEYEGVMETLVLKMKYGQRPYLAKGLGSMMAAYWLKHQLPLPDYVVPVPQSSLRLWERGYNQSALLAMQVAKILGRPYLEPLKRRWRGYSQAGMSQAYRMALSKEIYYLKKAQPIMDKTLLLVDDVMTTGMTLQRCTAALMQGSPKAIYGFVLCRAS